MEKQKEEKAEEEKRRRWWRLRRRYDRGGRGMVEVEQKETMAKEREHRDKTNKQLSTIVISLKIYFKNLLVPNDRLTTVQFNTIYS